MRQQTVHQGATPVARGRMHDQARRLMDHHEVLVFKHHIKVHPLGHKRLALRRGLQQDLHALPQHDLARRRGGDLGIDLDAPFINQSLEMTAGILGNAGGEVGVQALALGRERNLQAARLGNRAPCPNCVPHHLIDGLVISPIVVGKLGERHGFRQIRLGTGERTGGSRTSRSGHMAIKTGVGAK